MTTQDIDNTKEGHSLQAVVRAAQRLVERLEYIHNDPSYQSVWTSWMIHHGQYAGPKYAEELDALRESLAAVRSPNDTSP